MVKDRFLLELPRVPDTLQGMKECLLIRETPNLHSLSGLFILLLGLFLLYFAYTPTQFGNYSGPYIVYS